MLIILGYVQKRYGLSTKTMFNVVAVGIICLAAWGIIGIFSQKVGYKVRATMTVFPFYPLIQESKESNSGSTRSSMASSYALGTHIR